MERDSNQENLLNQEPNQPPTSSFYSMKKQVIAALFATLTCLLNGCVIGFTGPALPSLLQNTTSVTGSHLQLDLQQASWITSILSIGCFTGCLLAGPIMEKFGRKRTLLFVSLGSYALGFIFIFLAVNDILIYIGRFLNGAALGSVLSTVTVYIIEIATDDMRGLLGCFVQFQGSIGILLSFCIGAVLNWWQLALAHLVLVLPSFIAICFIPESPRWLILKGNEWEGEVSLKWLRGRDPLHLDKEIEQIKREIGVRKRERVSITLLLEPEVIRPFMVSLMMMLFLQMSGFNVMVFYCGTIFVYSGSSINPSLSNIIVGVVLLASCFIALGVVTRLGRKVILVVSILGMGVCHALLGFCFHYNSVWVGQGLEEAEAEGGENQLGFLPLLSVIGFLFLGNVGYGTLIWVVTAELLPPKVRSIANSFIICFAFVTGFLVAKTFIDLIQSIGYAGTFWLYAGICFAGAVFTVLFIPETRDRSLEDIQNYFLPRSNKQAEAEVSHPLETVS